LENYDVCRNYLLLSTSSYWLDIFRTDSVPNQSNNKTKEKISSGEISQEEGNLRIDALQAKLD